MREAPAAALETIYVKGGGTALIVLVIFGLLFCITAFFLLGSEIRVLIKGKRAIGKICELKGNCYTTNPGIFNIEVQFSEGGQDIRLVTLNSFCLTPYFRKFKLSRLRKKHIGKQVHIYYNPDNKRQVLLREYMWKEFLMAAFLFFLGVILIWDGIGK